MGRRTFALPGTTAADFFLIKSENVRELYRWMDPLIPKAYYKAWSINAASGYHCLILWVLYFILRNMSHCKIIQGIYFHKVFLIESLLGSIRKLGLSFQVHRLITAPEEFENGGLTLINASNVFLHTSKGNLKTQQSPVVYFGFCLKKTLSGGHMTIVTSSFLMFPATTRKRNAAVFKFLRLEGLEKLRFRDGFSLVCSFFR